MKQKYAITKDSGSGQMTIQEFAELDKDVFSLVCEESYDSEKIRAAAAEGREPLIEVLRTPNLYPVSEYAERIADTVKDLFTQTEAGKAEIEFDDIEALGRQNKPPQEEEKEEDVGLDDLLDEEEEDSEESEDEEAEESTISEDEEDLDLFSDKESEDDSDEIS
jgi:hypothetical protein